MKILHFGKTFDAKYGGPVFGIISLSKENFKSGHQTFITSLDSINNDNSEFYKIIFLGRSNYKVINYYYLYTWLRNNYKNYDVIILNGVWELSLIIAYYVLKNTKTPYFIFPHGMLDPIFKKLYPIKNLKKYLSWLLIFNRAFKNSKGVFFTCDEELKLARNSFKPYKISEFNIKYGVEKPPPITAKLTTCFHNSYPNLKGKKIILFLSRIHDKKGLNILIDAMPILIKKISDIHLIVAGNGDSNYVSKLKSRAELLGADQKISWVGDVYGEDKWQLFYNADVFCLPTHQENFGIAIVEALACGLPVVSTKRVNIWPIIESCGAGFFGEDNLHDLVQNLSTFFTLGSEQASEMKQKAIECYVDNFTIEVFSKTFLKAISE